MVSYPGLQAGLARAWTLNKPGSAVEHVLVGLPSYSVGESLLAHYAPRIPALEHRFLVSALLLPRIPGCELVFLTCEHPGQEILDYYAFLVPAEQRADAMARLQIVEVPDHSPRAIAAKLLDRPDLLATLRAALRGRPAIVEPWNVTEHEVEVATALGAPLNGTPPALWPLGYKSAGRRLFTEVGVPVPFGYEDVRTVGDVVAAIAGIRERRPAASGIVIKHDDSGAGDGNAVIGLRSPGGDASDHALRRRIEALPGWYVDNIRHGSVVEELIAGTGFASPSAQVDVSPFGEVTVIATHEQLLDPETGQVYTGCRFPANPVYAAEIARHASAIGDRLAQRGVIGRFGVDFAAACDAAGHWQVFALEINLRKGGTSHPFSVLRNLVPGRYDDQAGRWLAADGRSRSYYATDNMVDPAWLGLPPSEVIKFIDDAGLRFDAATGTGVVVHMLSCLAIDGRFGLTAIGRSNEHAAALLEGTRAAVCKGVLSGAHGRI